MKKTFPALVSAFLVTAFLALTMILVGQDALATSSVAAAGAAPVMNASAEAQVKQVLVEYQTRELQYQSELKSASGLISNADQQLNQANQQFQQYQSILSQLEDRGLVTIAPDGTITVH